MILKKYKRLKIICWFLTFIYLIVFFTLLITNFIFNYMDMFTWISLFFSFVALTITLMSIFINNINREIHEYKSFIIDYLDRKRYDIDCILKNIFKSMEEQTFFDKREIADLFLGNLFLDKFFESYYYKFSKLINDYDICYKNYLHNVNKDCSKIIDILQEFTQTRVNFELDINDIINKIYVNDIQVIKKIIK